jgi:VanZ family protein
VPFLQQKGRVFKHYYASSKKKMIKLLEKYSKVSWLFVIIIAGVIFYLSSLTFSMDTPGTNIYAIMYHIFAFFWLGFFLILALVKGKNKNLIFLAIILAFLYGVSDEIHQLFVPGRYFTFSDISLNLFGALCASLIYVFSLKRH